MNKNIFQPWTFDEFYDLFADESVDWPAGEWRADGCMVVNDEANVCISLVDLHVEIARFLRTICSADELAAMTVREMDENVGLKGTDEESLTAALTSAIEAVDTIYNKSTIYESTDMGKNLYHGKYPVGDAKYVVDYVDDNPSGENYYYQLVRLKDDAILCAHKDKKDIIVHCWSVGIPKDEVVFI